jgi:hypothetical protein
MFREAEGKHARALQADGRAIDAQPRRHREEFAETYRN